MKSTTHNKVNVVSLLITGFTLMVLPLSVFSQSDESSSTAVTPVDSTDVPYEIQNLNDDRVFGDFVVGPGKIDVSLAPGESKIIELNVTNRMGEPKIFKFEIEDIEGSNDPTQPVVLLGDSRGPYTLKDYIDIPHMEFTLEHMDRATIPVTISLPADAEPGGRYGSVVLSTATKGLDTDRSGTAPSSVVVNRIGTLFFITTPGSTDASGELVSFSTLPDQKVFTHETVSLALAYENTGSLHLNPYGTINITNIFNDEVAVLEVDPWFSLPKSLRTREISWDRELVFGRYTATAKINRGYDDIVDEMSVTFWVLPWKPLVGIFVGLFAFFLLIRFVATRFEFKRKE